MDKMLDDMRQDRETTDWVGRARALIPMLAAAGPHGDATAELAAEVVEALHDAGLFQLLVPEEFGGGEVDLLTFSSVIEAIGEGDGSAAWCLGQNAVSNMTAAYMPRDAAAKLFGEGDTVLCWGAGVLGRAEETEDGYLVSGRWGFASGSRHANWIGGQSPIIAADGAKRLEPDGSPSYRMFVFPKTACTITQDWEVSGLRGTGSDTYEVTKVFVPKSHAFLRTLAAPHPGALYRTPLAAIYPIAFASVALGLAQAMLNAFLDMARNKTPRGLKPMRDSDVIQSILGEAATRLGSARTNLRETIADISGRALEADRDIKLRVNTTFAIREATAVADLIYGEAGATAILADQPFERRFRDIHAVAQQVQGRRANYELAGKRMLGLETGPLFI